VVPPPLWVEHALGSPAAPFTPKLLRVALGALILQESSGKCRTVVMDPGEQHPGEDESDFFHRLELDWGVDSYFIIVPSGTKVLGTVFEGGMLIRDLHYGKRSTFSLFPQASSVDVRDDGEMVFIEKGKRTQYLKSLARKASHVQPWTDFEDLREAVLSRALIDNP
jgi:hypothetical protein